MKILCISLHFFDYTIQMANALSQKGEVLLMLPETISPEDIQRVGKNVQIILFPFSKRVYHPDLIVSYITIRKNVYMFKPDVIHVQVQGLFLCYLLPILKRYPLVATFHDIVPHPGEEKLLHKITLFCFRKNADKILVHGNNLKSLMIDLFDMKPDKIYSIPIGEHEVAPFKQYERGDINEDVNNVLFFGRIRKYKGLEYLIRAEPLITQELPNTKFVIAGAGEDLDYYKGMMSNPDNFICYHYHIPYKQGAELIQRSSIIVLPYIEASQSGVIPTAYGFNKPVIVTDVGSLSEIVDDGETGLVIPPKDVEKLAESIIYLLKNDEIRRKMGEAGYRKLKTDLSWDVISETIFQAYRESIN